ncbi:MAG TPA: PfkB family carbohydrate kinase [Geminicoccus sp.]|uniref:carbohydrate kinase family protein n=1 Tax=Geminicoccus sp. TaxID=2024832 RepID=UPI002E31D284|nr:PfkB family carbohydrate kinase [Geminicoccus sp.]HEX2528366.1 PfkB family carbohydrate kinase [Geminicoccus sp.]
MSGNGRPTIREVARLAGVSIGTVSNVLTGARSVAPSTRGAIESAISRLGYQPDQAGRVLNSRRRRGPVMPPPDRPRLTAVGYLCADLTARLPVLPGRDMRSTAHVITKTLGGSAANVAVVAAGLGNPFAMWVELMTVLGTDPESDWAADLLSQRGVALTPGSRRPDAQLSKCIVLVDGTGARTIVNEPLLVPREHLIGWLDMLAPAAGRHCLHIQGDQLEELMDVLPLARGRGLLLAFHTPGLPTALRTPEGLRLITALFDLVLLDLDVTHAVAGHAGNCRELVKQFDALLDRRRRAIVVVTLEADGAAVLQAGQSPELVPAEPVPPVDRTGAGDCFAGTFLAAWLSGYGAPAACRLAVLAASRSVTVPGAQEFRPKGASLLEAVSAEAV